MTFWDEARSKMREAMEVAKKGAFFVADKTKKGASSAKIQVDIRLEEGRRGNLHAELGKHVFDLMNNGIFDMSNDQEIKDKVEEIRKSDDKILKLKEQTRSV